MDESETSWIRAPKTARTETPFAGDFEERRRQMDQSETTWIPRSYGAAQNAHSSGRVPGLGPHTVPTTIDDIAIQSDDLQLPDGWRYDVENNNFVIEDVYNLSEKKMTPSERAQFMAAKRKELQSFFDNRAWKVATHKDPTRTLRARFLLRWREVDNAAPEAKARLVLQGFKDPDALSGNLQTSSPTASRLARQCVLAIAGINGWPPWAADVASAFLQGKEQVRKLLVQLPADAARLMGLHADDCMELLKPMYGQTDAPRAWYLEARDRLVNCGLDEHPLDPCLFMSYDRSVDPPQLDGLISMHVDDLLGAGSDAAPKAKQDNFATRVQRLKDSFKFRTWKSVTDGTLSYCGAELSREADGTIGLKFTHYWDKVKPITIGKHDDRDDRPATAPEVRQLRGLLGSIQ